MSIILRVEVGFSGPYWEGHIAHPPFGRTPAPTRDACRRCPGGTMYDEAIRVDFDARDARFGFDGVKQMREWFTDDELATLGGYGYDLSVIEVDDDDGVIWGEHQVSFTDVPLRPRIWRVPLKDYMRTREEVEAWAR